jgi:hypothetical protein
MGRPRKIQVDEKVKVKALAYVKSEKADRWIEPLQDATYISTYDRGGQDDWFAVYECGNYYGDTFSTDLQDSNYRSILADLQSIDPLAVDEYNRFIIVNPTPFGEDRRNGEELSTVFTKAVEAVYGIETDYPVYDEDDFSDLQNERAHENKESYDCYTDYHEGCPRDPESYDYDYGYECSCYCHEHDCEGCGLSISGTEPVKVVEFLDGTKIEFHAETLDDCLAEYIETHFNKEVDGDYMDRMASRDMERKMREEGYPTLWQEVQN